MSIPREAAVDYDDLIDHDARPVGPIHPGVVLQEEFLAPLGISAYALAKAISVPRNRISGIIRGERAITADTALRLARFFGTSAEFWLDLQMSYDLETTSTSIGDRLDKEVIPRAASRRQSEMCFAQSSPASPDYREGVRLHVRSR